MARLSPALLAGMMLLLLGASPRADEKEDAPSGERSPGGEERPKERRSAKGDERSERDKEDAKKEESKGSPLEGTWKVVLPFVRGTGGRPVWLLKLDKKDNGWAGEVIAKDARMPNATLKNLKVTPEEARFTLDTPNQTFPCVIKLPKGEKQDKLRGTANLDKTTPTPVELEKTTLTSLDSYDQAKEALAKQPPGHEVVQLAFGLLSQATEKKAKPSEVRSWVEKAIKSAGEYGAGWQRDIIVRMAENLADKDGYEAIALQYARRAERMLDAKDHPAIQKRVLTVLAAALEKAGKEAEAKEALARIKKLDFRIKPKPFAGRKSKSDRVVLVELFTGAQCPPCVAADLAFDALGKTFKPTEVVLLQYHLHIPQPDPLTSPDGEQREGFYDAIRGTPTILFNGKAGAPGGGDADEAIEKYDEYVGVIAPLLEKPSRGEVKLSASRKENKVSITAEVAKLAETGDDVRLRVVLVEEEVAYKGTNGLAVHHHVVRSMPGGSEGTVMKDKTAKKTFTVDLDALKKKLNSYLDKYAEKRPFPNKERPMALKNLRVVAFVQNDKTGEVLQAAQADVKSE